MNMEAAEALPQVELTSLNMEVATVAVPLEEMTKAPQLPLPGVTAIA